MIQALHRAPALPGDDVVKASVRKLSNEEARRYAELVVRAYGMFAGMKQQIHNGRGNRTPSPRWRSSCRSRPGTQPLIASRA